MSFTAPSKSVLSGCLAASAFFLLPALAQAKPCSPLVANKVCTDEEVPVTLTLADLQLSGVAFDSLRVVLAPSNGAISSDGNVAYVTGPNITYADIAAGKVVWTPNPNAVGTQTFQYQVVTGGTAAAARTLTLGIDAINDAPQIHLDQTLLNPNLEGTGALTNVPYWTLQGNVRRYGSGLVFNTGQSDPTGVVQQTFPTVVGETYTVTLSTSKLGNYRWYQKLRVSVLNGGGTALNEAPAAANILVQNEYGQDVPPTQFTFVATGSQSTLHIADITPVIVPGTPGDFGTTNTDIMLLPVTISTPNSPLRVTREDTPLIWRSNRTNGEPLAITVSDVDGTAVNLTLGMSVTNGTLNLGSTAGITFNQGSQGAASMTISGTQADINKALDGLTYSPTANYFSPDANTDRLTLHLDDNGGAGWCSPTDQTVCSKTDDKVVSLQVLSVNDAPLGTNNTVVTNEDTPYVLQVADFGFSDPVEGNAFAAVHITTLPTRGALKLNGLPVNAGDVVAVANLAGALTWTPDPLTFGAPYGTFTFQVQDDGGTANGGVDTDPTPKTMILNVLHVNHPPTTANTSFTTNEDVAISVFASASDVDAMDTLTYTNTQPAHGVLTNPVLATSNGVATVTFLYTPTANYHGPDSFTITFNDGNGGTAMATVAITVNPVNDPPVGTSLANQVATDGASVSIATATAFSDPDGDVLSYAATGLPAGLTIDPATGVISGTLGAGASKAVPSGVYSISVTATDPSNASSAPVSFTLTVSNVPPVANDVSVSTEENVKLTGSLASAAHDGAPDTDTLSFSAATQPAHGQLTLHADGSYEYTPEDKFTGTDSFTYTVDDGNGGTATAKVTIIVTEKSVVPVTQPVPTIGTVGLSLMGMLLAGLGAARLRRRSKR